MRRYADVCGIALTWAAAPHYLRGALERAGVADVYAPRAGRPLAVQPC
jgi:hypothetical protein